MKTVLNLLLITIFIFGNFQISAQTGNNLNNDSLKYREDAEKIILELSIYLYDDKGDKEEWTKLDSVQQTEINNEFLLITDNINVVEVISGIKDLFDNKIKLTRNTEFISEFDNDSVLYSIKDKEDLKSFVANICEGLETKPYRLDDEEFYLPFKAKIYEILNEDIPENIENLSTQNDGNETENKEKEKGVDAGSVGVPIWLYVVLGILFLLICFAIFLIYKLGGAHEKLEKNIGSNKQMIDELKLSIDSLNNKIGMINITSVKEEMHDQLNILTKRINEAQFKQSAREQHSNSNQPQNTPLPKPEPKIFYAQYPDSGDPVGFKNVHTETNSKMVFKITTLEGNRARFTIQSDENTQQYAIGNHGKILKSVCEYLSQPSSSNKTIRIIKEGRLEMKNNIWIVLEKLEIRFE